MTAARRSVDGSAPAGGGSWARALIGAAAWRRSLCGGSPAAVTLLVVIALVGAAALRDARAERRGADRTPQRVVACADEVGVRRGPRSSQRATLSLPAEPGRALPSHGERPLRAVRAGAYGWPPVRAPGAGAGAGCGSARG
ncbi:MAG: hypothetical protein IPM29_18865 [Planctomycetes bacterium]|nr:hypothetical protein [Planctomycetota bacterium]